MRNIILLLLVTCCSLHAISQTGTIKGTVKDSIAGVALESATVTILKKDSSIVNYPRFCSRLNQ